MPMHTCATCKYREQVQNLNEIGKTASVCRYLPPTMIPIVVSGRLSVMPTLPIVQPGTDYCGQYSRTETH